MPLSPEGALSFTANPLLGAVLGSNDNLSHEMEEYREKQKERELHLLGTMLFQALMLALCIVLYVKWTWSHFNSPWESAVFYGFAGFSVQAGFYFIYRAMFEDTASHRRQLKKMRHGNKRKMAGMKFEVEKSQQELMLQQQMVQFQNMLTTSIANDGYIDQAEDMMLQNQMASIQAQINQMKLPPQQAAQQQLAQQQLAQQPMQLNVDPKTLGMDRHTIMGIPVGPSLLPNFNLTPVASTPIIPSEQISSTPSANLMPNGADEILHSE